MRRFLSALVLLAALAAAPAAQAWIWPATGPVLRPFSLGPDTYASGQHRGVDIGAAVGSPVVAPAAGEVSFVGSLPGGGRAITIQTADGYAVTLLQLGSTSVQRGSEVAEGAVVGEVGESADAVTSASHVHLGVRVAADPDGYVDPLGLLPALGPEPAPVPAPAPSIVPEPQPASEPVVAVVPAEPNPPVVVMQPVAVAAPTPPAAEVPVASALLPEPAVAAGETPATAGLAGPSPEPAVGSGAHEPVWTPRVVRPRVAVLPASGPARAAHPPTVDARAVADATPVVEARTRTAPARPTIRKRASRPVAAPRANSSPRNNPPVGIHDRDLVQAAERSRRARPPRELPLWPAAALLAALATAVGYVRRRGPALAEPARIMGGDDAFEAAEDPGRGRLAVCERTPAHRPRGGLRRPVGHLRPLPPAAGQRRADGERHRRARHAGDGGRGRGRSLAA